MQKLLLVENCVTIWKYQNHHEEWTLEMPKIKLNHIKSAPAMQIGNFAYDCRKTMSVMIISTISYKKWTNKCSQARWNSQHSVIMEIAQQLSVVQNIFELNQFQKIQCQLTWIHKYSLGQDHWSDMRPRNNQQKCENFAKTHLRPNFEFSL